MPLQLPPPSPKPPGSDPKTFSGWLAWGLTAVPQLVVSTTAGLVSAAQGNTFSAGFDEAAQMIEAEMVIPVVDFADRHNRRILDYTVAGTAAALVQVAHKSSTDHPDPNPVGTVMVGAASGAAGALAVSGIQEISPTPPPETSA